MFNIFSSPPKPHPFIQAANEAESACNQVAQLLNASVLGHLQSQDSSLTLKEARIFFTNLERSIGECGKAVHHAKVGGGGTAPDPLKLSEKEIVAFISAMDKTANAEKTLIDGNTAYSKVTIESWKFLHKLLSKTE
ncbi:MAG: hypothetical protein V4489_04490 [Chlamydiota bacterium]